MHFVLSPDLALLLSSAGLLLIFIELNRPGTILFGSVGLLFVLLGAAALAQHPLRPWALALLGVCTVTLALNLYRALPLALLSAATLGLIVGFRYLLAPPLVQQPIHLATSIGCGGLLGLSAAFLSRVAFRARRLKAIH